jgi:hypothetical protein
MRFCWLALTAVPSGALCMDGSEGEGTLTAFTGRSGTAESAPDCAMPPKVELG